MAQFNFPDPAVTQTYTEAGITWTWNATLGVWSSKTADGGEGASVSVGPTPPADAEQGDLWWNNSDDSGRLYVYYDDGNSQQWVEASPEGSGLTESDADGLYLSKVDDDTAAGAITFEKLTTHNRGVKVTGGSDALVGEGLTQYATGSLGIIANGKRVLNIENESVYAVGLKDNLTSNEVGISCQQRLSNLSSPSRKYWSFESNPDISGNWWSEVNHYYAENLDNSFSTAFASGFYSNLSNVTTNASGGVRTQYNFYAAGDAPNYFKGTMDCRGELSVRTAGSIGDFPGAGNTNTGFRVQPTGVGTFSANHANATDFVTLFNRTNFNGTLLSFRKNGNERGSIFINDANISIVGQASDYRLKKNIQPFASSVDKVKAINVVNFEYTDRAPGVIQEGFVAHELAEICPKAVVGTKDATEAIGTLADYDGNVLETEVTEPDASELTYTEEITDEYGVSTQTIRNRSWTATGTRPVYQGVDQTKLIPLLTKALQETIAKNEELEARIAALEGA